MYHSTVNAAAFLHKSLVCQLPIPLSDEQKGIVRRFDHRRLAQIRFHLSFLYLVFRSPALRVGQVFGMRRSLIHMFQPNASLSLRTRTVSHEIVHPIYPITPPAG